VQRWQVVEQELRQVTLKILPTELRAFVARIEQKAAVYLAMKYPLTQLILQIPKAVPTILEVAQNAQHECLLEIL
jgi:hypothetical protein